MSAKRCNRLFKIHIVSILLIVFAFYAVAHSLYAAEKITCFLEDEDMQYFDLLKKGKELEQANKLDEALRIYYTSLSFKRYEACSYYAMIDMARIYLKKNNYPAAIFFLESYIVEATNEIDHVNLCAGYSEVSEMNLKKTKVEAEKMLKKAIKKFCREVNDDCLCKSIKPYK